VDAEREAQMRYIMIANTPNNYVCITVHSAHGLKDASGWISTMVRTPAFMPGCDPPRRPLCGYPLLTPGSLSCLPPTAEPVRAGISEGRGSGHCSSVDTAEACVAAAAAAVAAAAAAASVLAAAIAATAAAADHAADDNDGPARGQPRQR
jgi:hypothetical protein